VHTVIMEVSAQAIYLHKMHGISLKYCVFTNISNEHLDFFKTMENYAKVKMNYFNKNNMQECVVNIDDFYGRELAYKLDMPCISYGINAPANSFAMDIVADFDGVKFLANIMDDVYDVNAKFLGVYNIYNLLASMTICKLYGMTNEQIKFGVKSLKPIEGRFNVFYKGNKKIIVDFAHTPDSIDKVLSAISNFAKGDIVTLFGCVGYSDREKRIEMAQAVERYSNKIIITSDNPGNVDFKDIANDIIFGIQSTEYMCIEDRITAIQFAFNLLKDNDILVLLGKGAETFQKIGDQRIPFSDLECVKQLLQDKE